MAGLEAFVSLESPSFDLKGLAKAADWIEQQFRPLGSLKRQQTDKGPLLLFTRPGARAKVLLLCHFDTVHPRGSFCWRLDGDKAFGPGIYDMKGNIVQLLFALRSAEALGLEFPSVEVLFTPDEEVGSFASRAAIEERGRANDLVLVLEAPMGNGDIKVARKGVGQYILSAHGKAAHQGVEPEKGVNAIVELAHQIPRIIALQDWDKGTTLGPNVINGGTTSNVVADDASVTIDLRVWTLDEASRVEGALKNLQPVLAGAELQLEGGMNRPPMEPSAASMKLFEKARTIGETLGLRLGPGRVGGGSDGNFTAALGIPTLDGLGLFGGDAHQKTEHLVVSQIPERIALLAGLLSELAK